VSAYVHFSVCLHGLDAGKIRLRRDERHGALYLDLGEDVDIRIQVRPHAAEDPERLAAELGRDVEGLLRLAEVAAQVAQEIGQAAAAQRGEPVACPDHRPVLDSAVGWYCPACGSDAPPDGSETSGGAR